MTNSDPSIQPAGEPGGVALQPAGGGATAVNTPAFFAALGNALRWEMVKLIVSRGPMTSEMMSKAVGREFDGVSKHLRLMCRARVLRVRPGKNRRHRFYHLPDGVLRADGVLDYGFCVVRL